MCVHDSITAHAADIQQVQFIVREVESHVGCCACHAPQVERRFAQRKVTADFMTGLLQGSSAGYTKGNWLLQLAGSPPSSLDSFYNC
jgi:hypothetical protein